MREKASGNCRAWNLSLIHISSHGIDKAIVDCNPIALERAALAGDEVAAQVWRDLAVKLSCALMNCCYLLNPEAIIIGGGVAKAKTLLFEPLQEIMRTPVSYTHLDVYKRQVCTSLWKDGFLLSFINR